MLTCSLDIKLVQVYFYFVFPDSFVFCFFFPVFCAKELYLRSSKLNFFVDEISSGFKKADLVSMTRAATEDDKNIST